MSIEVPLGVVGFIVGHLVHWGAPWWSSGSSEVSVFIRVRPGGRPGSLGVRPLGLWVHPGSLV